ncbi:MAG: branched-chain amino acid ABC transporter permease, partial [Pseudomonadota bacterium]|nr:branched-chain amino acid ABC transporter permease [Pseudomonadota bacterium]
MTGTQKSWVLHLGIIALLFVLQFVLPAYHHGSLARIMVLTCYAMGYNILFGYTGLLSLGHALFFAAGMYGLSLSIQHLDWAAGPALMAGLVAGFVMALVIGMLLLRTAGVAFMIVTLMFAQAGYLTVLYFGEWTRGDEGFVIRQELRRIAGFDLSDPTSRYFAALLLMSVCIIITLRVVQTGFGRVLVAIRENE